MNNDKLVLLDSTEITLESSLGMGTLNVLAKNMEEVCKFWKDFSDQNLKQVILKNGDGIIVGKYQSMIKDHMEVKENKDGSLLVTFSLREKSAIELMEERLSAVESGQQAHDETIQTHNEAISDLGQAVSDMMEGGV